MHKDLLETNKEITPFYDLLLSDQKIESISQTIQEIESIDHEIDSLMEQKNSGKLTPEIEATISEFESIIPELRDVRNSIVELCRQSGEERKDDTRFQKKLFKLVFDVLIPSNKIHLYQREIEVLKQTISSMDEVYKMFQKDKIEQWCNDANTELDNLQSLIDEKQQLLIQSNQIENQTTDSKSEGLEDEEEIRRLEMEIEELQNELVQVNEEKIKMQEQVETKKEALFKQIQMNDIYIIYQGSNLQKSQELREFKEGVTCPICKERECCFIIGKKKCHHAFCKECVTPEGNSQASCPICHINYKKDDLVEFKFVP